VLAGGERGRLERADVVEGGAVGARDLQGVAEALRGEEADRGPLALQDGVGADRRPVDHAARARQVELQLVEGVEEADARVGGVGRGLADLQGAARLVVHHDVGEGPAHVDPNPKHLDLLPTLPLNSAPSGGFAAATDPGGGIGGGRRGPLRRN
jgi:hypothetical protein